MEAIAVSKKNVLNIHPPIPGNALNAARIKKRQTTTAQTAWTGERFFRLIVQ